MKRYQIKSCWLCGFLFVLLCLCIADMTSCAPKDAPNDSLENSSKWWETNEEIQILREYLKIPSVHPNPDYGPCLDFIKLQADSLNLPLKIYYPTSAKKPTIVITLKGSEPHLPSILLNSHMDVVPVFPKNWKYPPFAAEIDDEGRIFARGSQDMKSLGMAYLAAISRLQKKGFQPKRTIHILFVPDEEIGSADGMKAFVKTNDFQALNVGFALDEGHVSNEENFLVFYGEKTIWQPTFRVKGHAGHGSLLLDNTPGEGLTFILRKLMERRQIEVDKVKKGVPIGNVTSINLTKISGGIQTNVIPEEFSATFDIRLSPEDDHQKFEQELKQWIEESGAEIEVTFESKEDKIPVTVLDDSNPFWIAFRDVLTDLNYKFQKQILSGGTDMRFLRILGIPAIGFNPMNYTPVLPHDHNEFIYADKYIKAIDILSKIIVKLTDVQQ
ncbi:aminoacylase-1-like [Phlebotomus papatasi]|uniref:aminoacylase-1-like n=1 Tax=Phlebotomus papatasi TaxID=29031 RepID=UPI0024842472|nr:aminoacylase-1-like [Phlebotomus papatasi]